MKLRVSTYADTRDSPADDLAHNGDPWWQTLPLVFATLFLEALPVPLVLLLDKRAQDFLPKVRDWMNANS